MVTVLNEVGKLICSYAELMWKLWRKIARKLGLKSWFSAVSSDAKSENSDEAGLPLVLVLFALILYLLLCAEIFQLWEPQLRDSYLDAFYFVFISMSTIGFGDIVAETPSHAMTGFIFFLFGLSLVSMFVQLMNRKLEEQYLAALELLEAAYLGKCNRAACANGSKQVTSALKGVFAQQVAFGFIIQKSEDSESPPVSTEEEKISESEPSEVSATME